VAVDEHDRRAGRVAGGEDACLVARGDDGALRDAFELHGPPWISEERPAKKRPSELSGLTRRPRPGKAKIDMRIALTHNLKITGSPEEAEFDSPETIDA